MMRMFPRDFPPTRRKRPKRQAEKRVFEALASITRQGFVYYEWRRGYEHIELDFAVWIAGLGRFALQVKGGRYLLIDGDWHLRTKAGVHQIKKCPLDEAKLAALDLHDDIQELADTTYNPFVIPIVVFTDMDRNQAIENLARRKGVYPIWGAPSLLANIERVARSRSVSAVLDTERIAHEVSTVTDGMVSLDDLSARITSDEAQRLGPATGEHRRFLIRLTVRGAGSITVRHHSGICRCGHRIRVGRGPER